MTSLAKQLERLAVPHTRAVYGEDKRRKSLLFDPKEAAALDKEAVFAIGTNGIAELQAIDPVFDEFQEILFGESTMSFQRSIQTAEVNAQIDETIESFLQKLSPYCLLKPAQKALEWLIYRFDIDVYNIDSFMVCLLPFHESKIFIRAVQLLKLKSKTATKWDWLLPIQSSGVHLPRQTLINHCNSNIGFLSFLCDKIYKTIKGTLKRDEEDKFRVIFSFYMSMVVGVLEFGGATENLVSSLLPHLSRGLKSKVAQYRAATYMILAQLVFKSSLQQDLLKSLLSALFKRSILKLERETMTCAALIFQHQKIKSLPARSFKHICRQPGLIESLKTLTSEGCCDGLTLAFLERLVVMAVQQDSDMSASESSDSEAIWSTPQYLSILNDFLSSVPLSESVADQLTKEVMENYLLCANNIIDDEGLEELSSKHKKTVQLLEDRYPVSLDRAVQSLLEDEEDERVKKMIQDFLNLSVLSLRHQHLSDMDGTLSLSINHRTPSIRVGAVQYLLKNTDKCDSDYISETLSARLADDSLEVVEAVLEAGQSLWSMLSDNTRLCHLLGNIVLRCQPWSDIGTKALQVLCSCDPTLQSSVILQLFPRLLLCTSDDMDFLKDLCDTVLAKSNLMVKSVAQKLKKKAVGKKKQSAGDVAELSVEVTEWLAAAVIKMPDCDDFLSELEERGDSARYRCHLALFLNAIIPLMSEQKNQLQWCGKQLKLLHQLRPQGQPRVDWEEVITMVTDTCQSLVASQIQGNSISLYLLSNLIKLVPSVKIDAEFWDFDDESLILSVRLFDYLLLLSNSSPCRQAYRKLVIQFLQHFPDSNDKLKFLGLLWTQHCNDLSERSGVKTSLQIQALLIGKQLLQQSETMKITDTVIINLVLALTSPFVGIRQTSIECLKFLTGKGNLGRGALATLVNHILQCEVEIDADQGYLMQAVGSVLDSEPRKGKRRSQSGRKADSSLGGVIVDVVQNSDTPHYIRNSLLQITALHNNKSFLCDLLPTLRSLLSTCHGDSPPVLAVESCGCLIQRFTPDTCSTLDSHPEALNLVLEMLASPVKGIQENMISQVTGDFYNKLTPDTQQQILSCLFDVWVKAPDPGTVKVIRKTLKHLTLESSHIVEELNKCLQTSPSASTVKERKKHRKSDVHKEEEDVFEQLPWQRVVVVLETIQNKKKISNYLQLLPTLLKILSEVLNSDQHSSAEYIKQLLLSVVDEVCQKAINHDLIPDLKKETSFNIDLIVNAIRTSSNPQTHHKALLLLTTASKIFPEDLLHKVMSVFTFMGANIMRHDDQYSFHVINRILETVVPALVTACEKREAHAGGHNKEEVITMVMQVFVDAYCHIPEHRRLMLFTRLVEIVGGDNFLWRCVLLKMTQEITRPTTVEKLEEEDSEVQFDLNLLSQFSITTQINSIATMINYVSELPVDKPTETTKRRKSGKHSLEKVGIFQVETHTAKQLRHFKFRTVKLLLSWCVSPTLVQQLSACEEGEITSGFHHLIQTILTYICSLMELKLEDQTLAKFYRALTHKMYDLLDKVVGLLPEKMLLRVIKELMDHSIPNIQRKSMELLNNFLLQKEHSEEMSLLGVVDKLLKVCVAEKTEMTTKQTALYSLKLLCRRIGADHPQMFIKVLNMAVEIFCCEGVNQSLQASALLCISEVCSTLKAHVIAHLSTFIPKVISCLKDRQLLDGNELFLLSVITAVLRVMENLCLFLSPYLQDIVTQICSLSGQQTEVLQKATIQQRLKAIRITIATSLPPRVLLGILPDCYNTLLTLNPRGIQPMMTMLTDHVSHMKKEDLNSHLVQLQGFYLTCLDVQAQYKGEVEDIEDSVIDAIVATVMKLSEATFRPMFYKMFDWATREEELKHRILVFYKMADRLAGKMQSLFTIFAGHIIVHAAQILKDNNKELTGEDYFDSSNLDKHKAHKLLVYICDCLYKCFLYDTEGFVTKERFDTLLQPLVDQLENVDNDDETLSKERVSEHLVPCLVQFGAATQDDSLWKTLNYQILLKTRHSSSAVRYAALIAVDEFHKKLSEDYMPLLPETIPFLAELMEDEEEEVEKMCQSVISQMEKTLGEPLQKYF